jgi:biopolymer transport protein ExbB
LSFSQDKTKKGKHMGYILDFFQLIFLGWPSSLSSFMTEGGDVLWLIAILTLCMWALSLERLWYYRKEFPEERTQALNVWHEIKDHTSWHARKIQTAIIGDISTRLNRNRHLISSMVALCPLLGLLGTVTGMIEVFHVMAVTGGGDAKLMAGGVSRATIPTMAGMVAAISGIFINTLVTRELTRHNSEFTTEIKST